MMAGQKNPAIAGVSLISHEQYEAADKMFELVNWD